MTPQQLEESLTVLGMSAEDAGKLIGTTARTVRRYLAGTRAIPEPVARLFRAARRFPAVKVWLAKGAPRY